jgi:CDP-diacylglycerol--glycerol-3-phosphate 3-phosphatidyltransferase
MTTPLKTPPAPQTHDELDFNTTSNYLTLLRMALVPLVIWALMGGGTINWHITAALSFGFAAFTDWLDGYIARTQNTVTIYGQLLDPLADKFLVIASLIALQSMSRVHPVIVMILIGRELGVTSLRALASAEGLIIGAEGGGKWKAAIQMVAIPFMMVDPGIWGIPLFKIGEVLLYISVFFSLWSAKTYIVGFLVELRKKRALKKQQKKLRKSLGKEEDS